MDSHLLNTFNPYRLVQAIVIVVFLAFGLVSPVQAAPTVRAVLLECYYNYHPYQTMWDLGTSSDEDFCDSLLDNEDVSKRTNGHQEDAIEIFRVVKKRLSSVGRPKDPAESVRLDELLKLMNYCIDSFQDDSGRYLQSDLEDDNCVWGETRVKLRSAIRSVINMVTGTLAGVAIKP